MTMPIRYTITPFDPHAHIFRVSCSVDDPDPAGQRFRLPAWIPGSYMIREFARNIISLSAEADGQPVTVRKCDKHTWQADPVAGGGALVVSYDVYAWDLSVRAAHLDQTHGFFNGTSVFLAVEGRTGQPCVVDIRPPAGSEEQHWHVATALASAEGERDAATPLGFGRYHAADYDELIDHPVEMGTFTHAAFDAAGVRHEIALTGRHDCDTARLCADLEKICAWHIELFGTPAPMRRYLFLAMVVGDGYGGLEHRASTALLVSRKDLPYENMKGLPDGYKSLLGLCSHEYFHAWNVKRIKPTAFTPYDLGVENYTRLLWVFEGFTSYYDDLALVRSGVIGVEDYLGLLGKTVSGVLRGSGRLKQSVADSSFDAWIKYYRQDENAPNAIVSYYAKGALIALALDLQLRSIRGGERSLDDVMRLLWQRYGQTGVGVDEDDIFALVAELEEEHTIAGSGTLAGWLREAVAGTADLPLARLLREFGIDEQVQPAGAVRGLGVKLAADSGDARLANVYDDSPARRAGLSAGDVLMAVDGLKVDAANLEMLLSRHKTGERLHVHAFRRDELMHFDVDLTEPTAREVKLSLQAKPTALARILRKGWLGAAAG